MKIEIWSDVVCPFCYIGKRKFEQALDAFPGKDKVQIEWKSFQLMPHFKTNTAASLNELLVKEKGISLQQAEAMHERVIAMAEQAGLHYNLDKAVPVNTFTAHRFIHFAKEHNLQSEAEERLFAAYFTEGKNIDDTETLLLLGKDLGLDIDLLKTALANEAYSDAVNADIAEARHLGVQGVPFFVFDRKYAVSGAQDPAVFLQTLEKCAADTQ